MLVLRLVCRCQTCRIISVRINTHEIILIARNIIKARRHIGTERNMIFRRLCRWFRNNKFHFWRQRRRDIVGRTCSIVVGMCQKSRVVFNRIGWCTNVHFGDLCLVALCTVMLRQSPPRIKFASSSIRFIAQCTHIFNLPRTSLLLCLAGFLALKFRRIAFGCNAFPFLFPKHAFSAPPPSASSTFFVLEIHCHRCFFWFHHKLGDRFGFLLHLCRDFFWWRWLMQFCFRSLL
mmetsp:Transcript_17583/g.38339  ORF Transcript_17583/g.38339 Transcript_17583/m.38339 type:complete len:233 (+) Transcript_17583:1427-2125(+)